MSGHPYPVQTLTPGEVRYYWECEDCGTICAGPSRDGEFGTSSAEESHALGDTHVCFTKSR